MCGFAKLRLLSMSVCQSLSQSVRALVAMRGAAWVLVCLRAACVGACVKKQNLLLLWPFFQGQLEQVAKVCKVLILQSSC